jgi:hypothetical protein
MPRLGTGLKVPVLTVGNPPVATITVQISVCPDLSNRPRESHAQQDQVDCHNDAKKGENEGHDNCQECRAGDIGESSLCQADEAVVFSGRRQTHDYAKGDEPRSDPKGPPRGSLVNGYMFR